MQCKTLVVDDDPILVLSLKLHFADIGIEFEVAIDGQEALEKLKTFEPDIILSDIMMPRMDGYELHKQLRQNPDTARIPFIFLSAKSDISDQMRAYRLGIDDYVCKPFQISDLVQRMKRAIEHAKKIRNFQAKADFSGDLSQMIWTDILQIMELNYKSGSLVFRKPSGEQIGKVLFSNGRLISAQIGRLVKEEAFYTLMAIKKGSFEFSDEVIYDTPSIKSNHTLLLLQGSQMIDEYKELLRLMPDLNVSLKLSTAPNIVETTERYFSKWSPILISLIRKEYTIREILNSGIMSPIRAASLLLKFLKSGFAKIRSHKQSINENFKTFSDFTDTDLVKTMRGIEQEFLTGVLEFQNRLENQAIFFQKGYIAHAFHGKTIGKKALFRIFREQDSTLKFTQRPVSFNSTFETTPLIKILKECFREIEKLNEVDRDFWTKRISVNHQKLQKLTQNRELSGLRDLIALARQNAVISEIIDFSKYTDSKTYEQLMYLMNIGILQIK